MLQLISSCATVERTVTGCGGKLKSPVVKQKLSEYERKEGRIYPSHQGQMDYPSLISSRWRGKSSSGSKFLLSFFFLLSSDPGFSKQPRPALTSSIENCDKHLKTHQKRRNMPNGQPKPDKVTIFSIFSQLVTFCHRAIVPIVILNNIQCLVERPNIQRPKV